jgi:nicotinate-nucleotide--dimethylbenzimidazole phosphoribosyltransferase
MSRCAPGASPNAAPSTASAESVLRADLDRVQPLDADAMAAAAAHLDRLTKPPGSLGRLETLVIQLAGISGRPAGSVAARAIVVAAADHGVARRGVSAYPPEVTAQMVANFVAGGAAINALAAAVGARVVVVDAGVAGPIPTVTPDPRRGGLLVSARLRPGTADMTEGPAMTRDEALAAMATGRGVVADLRADAIGLDLLGIGEMGIGNTTAASALAAVFTGAPVGDVTGHGTGIDQAGLVRKITVIETALTRHRPDPSDPIAVLAAVGGLEIAVLVGAIIEAGLAGIPVVLDGFISASAALVAIALQPRLGPRLIAGHRSSEPGHRIVLGHLGLTPVLELDLRLGEASGAALAMGVIVAAAAFRDEMATFDSAGIAGPA